MFGSSRQQRIWAEWRNGPGVLLRVAFSLLAPGCVSDGASGDEATQGSIFGGSLGGREGAAAGGAIEGGSEAGGGGESSLGGGASVRDTRCSGVPIGVELRIDDFEDGNAIPRPAPDRQSFWAIQHDDTEGRVAPDGNVTPVVGGANGTDYALHVSAEGYSEWGINVDAHLRTESGGLNCPYNASNTRGLGMYLKGSGQVRIGASTAAIVATEFGGTCDPETQVCWDAHLKLVPLTEDWTYREISWDSLSQAGWGEYVSFEPGQLTTVRWGALPEDLPLDVWVDEIRFLPLAEAPAGE